MEVKVLLQLEDSILALGSSALVSILWRMILIALTMLKENGGQFLLCNTTITGLLPKHLMVEGS